MTPITHTAIDPLTGLPTYEAFVEELGQAIETGEQPFAVGLVDIDKFGKINDRHGREVGDQLVASLARQMAKILGERGQVHRYGGDALTVILPGLEKEEAFLLLEQVRAGFEHEHVVETEAKKVKFKATLSAGVASHPEDGASEQVIIRRVCEAIYRAKVSGRNRVCLAREEKMVTKTSHYTQGQLEGLTRLAKRMGVGEAVLLREALDDLLYKYNS